MVEGSRLLVGILGIKTPDKLASVLQFCRAVVRSRLVGLLTVCSSGNHIVVGRVVSGFCTGCSNGQVAVADATKLLVDGLNLCIDLCKLLLQLGNLGLHFLTLLLLFILLSLVVIAKAATVDTLVHPVHIGSCRVVTLHLLSRVCRCRRSCGLLVGLYALGVNETSVEFRNFPSVSHKCSLSTHSDSRVKVLASPEADIAVSDLWRG